MHHVIECDELGCSVRGDLILTSLHADTVPSSDQLVTRNLRGCSSWQEATTLQEKLLFPEQLHEKILLYIKLKFPFLCCRVIEAPGEWTVLVS